MKTKLSFREIIQDMVTNQVGSVSSKIIVGAVTYFILTVSLIVVTFLNPAFPGITELLSVLIITSGSLLGLTTVENIKHHVGNQDKTMHGGSD